MNGRSEKEILRGLTLFRHDRFIGSLVVEYTTLF
jgi:hypothetical protein